MLGINEYIRFINGESIDSILNKNETGTSVKDIINYNNRLERDHCFIQWVFPTDRISNFNTNCPILNRLEIFNLRSNKRVIDTLSLFKDKMFEYWGILPTNYERMSLLNGHNGLRLSRAIECLNFFCFDISFIIPILNDAIKKGILIPKYELGIPVWFIRYRNSLY